MRSPRSASTRWSSLRLRVTTWASSSHRIDEMSGRAFPGETGQRLLRYAEGTSLSSTLAISLRRAAATAAATAASCGVQTLHTLFKAAPSAPHPALCSTPGAKRRTGRAASRPVPARRTPGQSRAGTDANATDQDGEGRALAGRQVSEMAGCGIPPTSPKGYHTAARGQSCTRYVRVWVEGCPRAAARSGCACRRDTARAPACAGRMYRSADRARDQRRHHVMYELGSLSFSC